MKRRPELFAGRVTCSGRNFPGYDLVTAILDAGGHVIPRVSATVALPLAPGGAWLGDGSRLACAASTRRRAHCAGKAPPRSPPTRSRSPPPAAT